MSLAKEVMVQLVLTDHGILEEEEDRAEHLAANFQVMLDLERVLLQETLLLCVIHGVRLPAVIILSQLIRVVVEQPDPEAHLDFLADPPVVDLVVVEQQVVLCMGMSPPVAVAV